MGKIIFQIQGGRGKCVAATAVLKAIKTQYPDDDLIVVSGYPDAFLGANHLIKENLAFRELQYFWQRNIEGQHPKMMLHDPYNEADFILGKAHLIETWCKMNSITYNGEQPEFFINNREETFFTNQFRLHELRKPLMLIHTNGGAETQPNKYSWTRDIPISVAQKVVDALANDYHIMHIRRDDQLQLQNVTHVKPELRALAVLIKLSAKRLFIDSMSQHVAAAMGMPSVVCLLNKTVETQFGYDLHTNIIANPPTMEPELKHAYLYKFNIAGLPLEFPYRHEGEIHDADRIIDAVRNTPAPEKATPPLIPKIEKSNNKKEKPEPIESN